MGAVILCATIEQIGQDELELRCTRRRSRVPVFGASTTSPGLGNYSIQVPSVPAVRPGVGERYDGHDHHLLGGLPPELGLDGSQRTYHRYPLQWVDSGSESWHSEYVAPATWRIRLIEWSTRDSGPDGGAAPHPVGWLVHSSDGARPEADSLVVGGGHARGHCERSQRNSLCAYDWVRSQRCQHVLCERSVLRGQLVRVPRHCGVARFRYVLVLAPCDWE